MAGWVEDTIVVCVPVTLEYDPARVGRDYLVAEAERGLTQSLQHIAGHYRIEGGKAAVTSEWITVDERLPADGVRVLGFDGDRVFEAEVFEGQWIWVSNKAHGWIVTHWMPLPDPPA